MHASLHTLRAPPPGAYCMHACVVFVYLKHTPFGERIGRMASKLPFETRRKTDDTWKKIQERTFTNWFNDRLRGNLKVAKKQVSKIMILLNEVVTGSDFTISTLLSINYMHG